MGKVITPDGLSDLPEALDLDGLELPESMRQPAPNRQAPTPKPGQALTNDAPSGGYSPSDYVRNFINSLPKEDIKKTTGVDLDWLLKNTRRYGILEPLCNGTFTQYPVNAFTPAGRRYVTLSLWKTGKEPGWDCAMHPVKLRYASDENGQIKKNKDGEYMVEPYKEPLKKGDVLYFDGKPLSPDEMEHLRLTGHLGEPKLTSNRDGETSEVFLSCDPWCPDHLCQTNVEFAKSRLAPTIWRTVDGTSYGVKSIGCVRPGDENSPLFNAVVVHEMYKTPAGRWKEGRLVPSALDGEESILIPVSGKADISVGNPASPVRLNLEEKEVSRLVPSTTYFSKNKARVVTFLTPRQLSSTALAKGFWVGSKESLSYVIEGTKENAKMTPVRDDQHRAFLQWDAFSSTLTKNISYDRALKNELEKNEKAQIDAQITRKETPATSLVVGNKI